MQCLGGPPPARRRACSSIGDWDAQRPRLVECRATAGPQPRGGVPAGSKQAARPSPRGWRGVRPWGRGVPSLVGHSLGWARVGPCLGPVAHTAASLLGGATVIANGFDTCRTTLRTEGHNPKPVLSSASMNIKQASEQASSMQEIRLGTVISARTTAGARRLGLAAKTRGGPRKGASHRGLSAAASQSTVWFSWSSACAFRPCRPDASAWATSSLPRQLR